MKMARSADRRIRAQGITAAISRRRCIGRLDGITDSERYGLRSIGATAGEAAATTGRLLAGLLVIPGIWIFQGVLPEDADIPCVPHVVSAGRRTLLIESVTWPAGRYHVTRDSRIRCDGTYTGQSLRTLIATLAYWRQRLPADQRVGAVIVVHPIDPGPLELPGPATPDIVWTSGDEAVGVIAPFLSRERTQVSLTVLTALAAATDRRRAHEARIDGDIR